MANDPRFEVFPEREWKSTVERADLVPTGEFRWRFRAANGKISAVSGEGFSDRTDAHRAVKEFMQDSGPLVEQFGNHDEPILDVDD